MLHDRTSYGITASLMHNVRNSNIYTVILSVLDPRKCDYLKDYSLDFEHAYMTTYMRNMSILEEMLEMFTATSRQS